MTTRVSSPALAQGVATATASRWKALLVAGLLLVQAGLLGFSATQHSPTDLEPAFLAAGISHWQLGRFELYRVNPPLVRLIAALPAMAAGCKTDWSRFHDGPGSRAEFRVGESFVKANGLDSISLLTSARWACIPFSMIGAYFAFRWATELYGGHAGLVTLILYVFEPNLIGHGELITPDGACTASGIVAGYTFWRWLKQPSWAGALSAGVSLGLAELSKMSWLILLGLWPFLWIASRILQRKSSASQPPLRHLALLLISAIYVVNIGYGFDGTGTPLKSFDFVSKSMTGLETSGVTGNRFRNTWLGNVPVPFPRQYILGLDTQKKDLESFHLPSYLRGELKQGGWWYYYLYGLLVKVPCGTWGLFTLVVVSRPLFRNRPVFTFDETVLLLPALTLFMLVSSQTEFNIHLRYVFPSLGLTIVFLGQSIFLLTSCVSLIRVTAILLLGYSVVSFSFIYPHQLAYFNDFVGGPPNGHKHLLGSSLDWGQDLLFLRNHVQRTECVIAEIRGSFARPEIVALLFPDPGSRAEHAERITIVSPNVIIKEREAFPAEGEMLTPTLMLIE